MAGGEGEGSTISVYAKPASTERPIDMRKWDQEIQTGQSFRGVPLIPEIKRFVWVGNPMPPRRMFSLNVLVIVKKEKIPCFPFARPSWDWRREKSCHRPDDLRNGCFVRHFPNI